MNVVFENGGTPYEELKPGEVFIFHGDAYIKTNSNGSKMSVNCSTGISYYFDEKVKVTPAKNVELRISLIKGGLINAID